MSLFLTREDILARLQCLDSSLEGTGSVADILIVGGSALSLLYDNSIRVTADIDFIGSIPSVIPKEYLKSIGLSENAKTFFCLYGTDEFTSLVLGGFKNLTVRVLSLEDLTVMKLFSSRVKDYEDLLNYLVPKLDSWSLIQSKISTYRGYYFFDGTLPDLHVNNLSLLFKDLFEQKKVVVVGSSSSSLPFGEVLTNIGLLGVVSSYLSELGYSYLLDESLHFVGTNSTLLSYIYLTYGYKILI